MKKIFLLFVSVALSAGMVFAQDINQATENYNNGAMELQMGNNDAAIAYFQTALEMAEALGEEGAEVATNCRNIIPAVYLASAKDQIKAEQFDAAVEQLNKALEAAAKYENTDVTNDANELMPQVYVSKGNNFLTAKNFPEAEAAYRKALELDATNGMAHFRHGQALQQQDNSTFCHHKTIPVHIEGARSLRRIFCVRQGSHIGEAGSSRFRDRRGREHYNNGRYAPMRSEYRPDYDGPFGRDERGGDEMRPIGFAANWGTEMRMGSDASMPRYNEMERMPGNRPMMGGYMAGEEEYPKMDERTAMEWVQSMHNEDGSKSPHWTMDQVKQVMKQKSIDLEPAELFAIMNAIYADYDPVFKKHGVSNIDMYVDMSKAWLKDKDAVPNKAMAYYECIVKR